MRNRAFTLLEVLLAIGIFVIGFVAVASIFPVAAQLQRATVMDVTEQEFARSMKAMISAVATPAKLTAAGAVNDGNVYDVTGVGSILGPNDLAFPQFSTTKQLYAKSYARWNGSAWVFYNFLLRPDGGAAPGVFAHAVTVAIVGTSTQFTITTPPAPPVPVDHARPGDAFLDNNGNTYFVSEYDAQNHIITIDGFASGVPTQIWIAKSGLCKRIAVTSN